MIEYLGVILLFLKILNFQFFFGTILFLLRAFFLLSPYELMNEMDLIFDV